MTRTTQQRIADILEAIERCERNARYLNDADSEIAAMAVDAIERNLQVVGEAVKHLPSELTREHPEIPWSQIRGFRNILVHQYFGVESNIVEEVVQEHLPPLARTLRNWRDAHPDE